MLRKVVGAVVVLGLCLGIALADEFNARITKVDDNKVTFYEVKGKGKDEEKGKEHTMPVAKSVKVLKGKKSKDSGKFEGEEVKEGLKHKMFSKDEIPEKGVRAMIITDDSNKKITEIHIFAKGGKGGKDKDKQ